MEWLFLKIENGMALSLSGYIGREETIEDILRMLVFIFKEQSHLITFWRKNRHYTINIVSLD